MVVGVVGVVKHFWFDFLQNEHNKLPVKIHRRFLTLTTIYMYGQIPLVAQTLTSRTSYGVACSLHIVYKKNFWWSNPVGRGE